MSGDLLDLHVALTPCVIGYAEIAKALVANIKQPLTNHPYREWIGEYAGDAYQAVAQSAREQLTRLAAKSMTAERFPELCGIFAKASRLEADFWQMALDNRGVAVIASEAKQSSCAPPGAPNIKRGGCCEFRALCLRASRGWIASLRSQ